MDFAKIKNLVRGNGDKVIVVENGEPEAVVMSFGEYERLAGAALPAPPAALAGAGSARLAGEHDHATEERFDAPYDEYDDVGGTGEPEFVPDGSPEFVPHKMPIRLADIRLEDLPI